MKWLRWAALLALPLAFSLQPSALLAAAPLGTAFTYQGRLSDAGAPANGIYDLRCAIYDALANGNAVSSMLTNAATPVSNGLFTVTLDFGPGIFTGNARWLDIAVRPRGTGTFTPLSPRQPLTPVPYAAYAPGAGSAATAATVADNSITAAKLASDAGSLAKVTAGRMTCTSGLLSITTDSYLSNYGLYLRGNPDTDHGLGYFASFGGLIVDGPVLYGWGGGALGVRQGRNGIAHLPLIWNAAGNVGVGGAPSDAKLDVEGCLRINDHELLLRWGSDTDHGLGYYGRPGADKLFGGVNVDGPVLYGYNGGALGIKQTGNNISNVVLYWSASGRVGINNTNPASALDVNGTVNAAAFSGSGGNLTGLSGSALTAGSVTSDKIADGTIANADVSAAGIDAGKIIGGDLQAARLKVGTGHTLSGTYATIAGGSGNTASGTYATVAGGYANTASGGRSFAAGGNARALHLGSFVWADYYPGSPPHYFDSTDNNQFLVRASGGVGINNNAPQSDLSVARGMNVDQDSENNGTATNILSFGSYSGEGIGSQRWGTGNLFGLDFYTGFEKRVSITQEGFVGIGTNNPQTMLDVNGETRTKVVTITGGSDVAEPFEMASANLPKGSVVVIDERHAGRLKLSDSAYDTRVAGVISGANGIQPGLTLQQEGILAGGQHVALSGRVYVRADATSGGIKPGDLLTTSATPGHAMKATDRSQAQGAILGKAMSSLEQGQGLVLVLVSLQ